MTQPNAQQGQNETRPKFRAGQTVKFRHPDPSGGFDLTGHGLVLQVGGDGEPVKVLPLSLLHLDVDADNLEAVKAEDVLPHITKPNETEAAAS